MSLSVAGCVRGLGLRKLVGTTRMDYKKGKLLAVAVWDLADKEAGSRGA